jgi:hypothetical protein
VIGAHPLGGGWPVAIPHPLEPEQILIELELRDAALSISSTLGANTNAPERAPMVRPSDSSPVTTARTAVAIDRFGARAEMMSTALLVADDSQAECLLDRAPERHFRFDFSSGPAMRVPAYEVVLQ